MILNETVETKPEWITLQGKILDGGYELGAALETNENAAHFKVRILGDSSAPAYASFFLAEGPVATEQLQVWQDLRRLQHPNLKTPLASGRMRVDGFSAIYVVCSMPDETLSEILADRGLSAEECQELLKGLGQGLLYLHSHGIAHGAVSPEMAVAVGDSIQLSTECTRRINAYPRLTIAVPRYLAPEARSANVSMAADVWCLGATIFEALVQKKYEAASFNDLAALSLGPILQRCLDQDPQTRAHLLELIDPPANLRDAVTPIPPSARVKPLQVLRKPVGTTRIRPLDPAAVQLVKFDPASGIAPLKARVKSSGNGGFSRPITAGVAAIVVVILVVWLVILPKIHSMAEPPVKVSQQAKTAWPTQTIEGQDTTAGSDARGSLPPAQSAKPSRPAADSNTRTWRVVLGSYAYEKDADRRLQLLGKTHPSLNVNKLAVSPKGPYFVVVGGPMTQAEATDLRKRALSVGISRASYVASLTF